MNENNAFLGTGWSFPPTFDKDGGTVKMVSGVKDIEESLAILLSTSLGERVLQPEYGCNLNDFLFDPISPPLLGYLKDMVERAILYHEPRIDLEKINATPDNGPDAIEGRIFIEVQYSIRETNSRFNFVYDFYLKEGGGAGASGAGLSQGIKLPAIQNGISG